MGLAKVTLLSLAISYMMTGSGLANEGGWVLATAEQDGKPVILRARAELPDSAKKADYPVLVSVIWEYSVDANNGMPDSATNAQQWDFETAMEGIDKQQVGLLVVTTTGNGSKEWIWHATDSKTFLDQTNDLLAKLPEYPLKIDFADDPGWTLYEKYMSNIKDLE